MLTLFVIVHFGGCHFLYALTLRIRGKEIKLVKCDFFRGLPSFIQFADFQQIKINDFACFVIEECWEF